MPRKNYRRRQPSFSLCIIALILSTISSSSVASSFFVVPGLSFVPGAIIQKLQHSKTLRLDNPLLVKGGSESNDEENIISPEQTEPSPETTTPTPTTSESITTTTNSEPIDSATSASKLGPNAPPPGMLRKSFPNFPWHRLPNLLTYARCIAIPALIAIFYSPNKHIESGLLFALASYTDWLDGYLARRWDITSAFGAFLDPVADKLMVSTSLILLAGRYGPVVAVPATIILAREIAVSALREWMAQRGQRDAVKVGMQGKIKTALTMVALTVLLFVPVLNNDVVLAEGGGWFSNLYLPGIALLYMSTVVTVTSGSVYFIAAAPLLFAKE